MVVVKGIKILMEVGAIKLLSILAASRQYLEHSKSVKARTTPLQTKQPLYMFTIVAL